MCKRGSPLEKRDKREHDWHLACAGQNREDEIYMYEIRNPVVSDTSQHYG